MPGETAFDRTVGSVRDAIVRVGDTVVDPIVGDDGTIGFVAERNSYRYQVVGYPDAEFFHATFPFSVINQLEGIITVEDAREILAESDQSASNGDDADGTDPAESSSPGGAARRADRTDAAPDGAAPDDDQLVHSAAVAVLEQVDEEEGDAFQYNLTLVLSSSGAGYRFQQNDSGMVTGFQVFTKVFPAESDFSLTTFDRAVERVVTTGISGMSFVNLAFDFPAMVDVDGARGMPPWYIH